MILNGLYIVVSERRKKSFDFQIAANFGVCLIVFIVGITIYRLAQVYDLD